jgi:hypothetical protein
MKTKCFKIPKGQSEAVIRRRTDKIQWSKEKGQKDTH